MNLLESQSTVYIPLLKEYCLNTKDKYQNMWKSGTTRDVAQLHIPFCTNEYGEGVKSIYLGQDTYNTETYLEYLYKCYDDNKIEEYLNFNNIWVENVVTTLKYGGNNKYKFWNFISRLQMCINGYEIDGLMMNDVLHNVPSKVLSFGWGNVFPLELITTVGKYKLRIKTLRDYIKEELYLSLFNAAKEISKIKYLIQAYEPDYIFILTWNGKIEDDLFQGLNKLWNKNEYIENEISTYNISEAKTKIIWLNHPRAMLTKQINPDCLIKKIINRM